MRKKRRQSNHAAPLPRHPFLPNLHPIVCMRRMCLALIICFVFPSVVSGGESGRNSGWREEQKEKRSNANRYLIFGTVLNDQGFSLPGAVIRVRRSGEEKIATETTSDRRGEFAVRVLQGAEYDVTVTAKGFQDAVRKIDARLGDREDLVFRMQPLKRERPK